VIDFGPLIKWSLPLALITDILLTYTHDCLRLKYFILFDKVPKFFQAEYAVSIQKVDCIYSSMSDKTLFLQFVFYNVGFLYTTK
jgi:hypothetical protein